MVSHVMRGWGLRWILSLLVLSGAAIPWIPVRAAHKHAGTANPGVTSRVARLPDTWNGIHLGLSFNGHETNKAVEIGRVDYVFGADDVGTYVYPFHNLAASGVWHDFYIPWSEEVNPNQNAWIKIHHPNWILYHRDRVTPAVYPTPHAIGYMLDWTNPAVLRYIFRRYIDPALGQGGYNGIAFDDNPSYNGSFATGHLGRKGRWVQLYSGDYVDSTWVRKQARIMGLIRRHISTRYPTATISVNNGFFLHTYSAPRIYDPPNTYVDVIYDEGGFYEGSSYFPTGYLTQESVNNPYCTHNDCWLRKIHKLVWLQRREGKALFLNDQAPIAIAPYQTNTDKNARAQYQWMIANYLLVKYNHTYLNVVQQWDQSFGLPLAMEREFKAHVGHPLGDLFASQGVFMRRYSGGLAVVNPSAYRTHTILLPRGHYRSLYGHRIARYTMHPHTGLVLLNSR